MKQNAEPKLNDKVRDIVASSLSVNDREVADNARFIDDLGADSIDMVELAMEFEEAFGIMISDGDAERLRTVGEAISYLEGRTK